MWWIFPILVTTIILVKNEIGKSIPILQLEQSIIFSLNINWATANSSGTIMDSPMQNGSSDLLK